MKAVVDKWYIAFEGHYAFDQIGDYDKETLLGLFQ
jgi:hypothetical protein